MKMEKKAIFLVLFSLVSAAFLANKDVYNMYNDIDIFGREKSDPSIIFLSKFHQLRSGM